MAQGELSAAGELLERARSVCAGRSADDIRRIETLIEDRVSAKREVDAAERKRQQGRALPVQQFVDWATGSPKQFESSLASVSCAERAEADFGFCTAKRGGSPNMEVRYWKREPSAARYSFITQGPLTCEDLGEHRQVRSWSTAEKTYELCEITQRRSRDLSALLLRTKDESRMFIFSVDYLKKDPAFDRELRQQR
jgi:hypothetical protein